MKDKNAISSFTISRLPSAGAVVAAIAFVVHADMSMAVSPTNVQVNQSFAGPFSSNKQNEPSLAQNPTNPSNLIAGANDQIGEPACTNETPSSCPRLPGISVSGFYASFDGGVTWPSHGLIDLSVFHETAFGDPTQAFDSQGNAYYGTIAFPDSAPPTAAPSDFFVAKSTDGGRSYPTAAKVSGASPAIFDDKVAMRPTPTPTARSATMSTAPGRN
jgi:hypothetical protein